MVAAVRSPCPPAHVLPLSALREATSRDRLSGSDPVEPPPLKIAPQLSGSNVKSWKVSPTIDEPRETVT